MSRNSHASAPKVVLGTGAKGDIEHPELNEVQFEARVAAGDRAPADAAEGGSE